MLKICKYLLLIPMCICIASCGSTGENGVGTTVKVSASIKDGTSISSFFAIGTPGNFGNGSLSYSIKSDILPHPNGIVSSSVMITTAKISYTPLPDSSGSISPALPPFTKAVGLTVSAGGTGAVDNMNVTSSTVIQYLYDNFIAPPTGLLNVAGMQFNYIVVVEFSGYEINSGASITCDQAVGNMYVTK